MPASNRIADAGYDYDAAGNMTTDGTEGVTLTYDPENRITGASGYTYTYDADGNRVEKSNGSTGTLYWYMTPGIVAESDLTGALKSEYVFFNGERVARRDFGPTGPTGVFYYFSDHLNTASVITDSAGNIKSDSDYYPWGGELRFIANDANHYKFTGKERDETGLDYFGARYYSNGLGRFITPDWAAKAAAVPYAEFADPQSLNLYTYVRNLPTTKIDLNGHEDGVWAAVKAWWNELVSPFSRVRSSKDGSQAIDSQPNPVIGASTEAIVKDATDKVGTAVDKMAAVAVAIDPTQQAAALRSHLNGNNLGVGLAMAAPLLGAEGGLATVAEAFGFKAGAYAIAGNQVGGQLTNGAVVRAAFGMSGTEFRAGVDMVKNTATTTPGTLKLLEKGIINAAKSQGATSASVSAYNVNSSMAKFLTRKGFKKIVNNGSTIWRKALKIK